MAKAEEEGVREARAHLHCVLPDVPFSTLLLSLFPVTHSPTGPRAGGGGSASLRFLRLASIRRKWLLVLGQSKQVLGTVRPTLEPLPQGPVPRPLYKGSFHPLQLEPSFFFLFYIIYFWPCWVFIAFLQAFIVAGSGSYAWLLSTGSRAQAQ